jgi:four helix bundle protein
MKNDERFSVREPGRATADFEAFWSEGDDAPASLAEGSPAQPNRVYDLEERTARFGEAVIAFAKRLPLGPVNNRLIDQIVGAATSVGANYCEADDAVSKKEFIVNFNRCRKEARETKFFLRMIAAAEPSLKADARVLWREAKELNLIFSSIVRRSRGGSNDEIRMTNDEPGPKPRPQRGQRKAPPPQP